MYIQRLIFSDFAYFLPACLSGSQEDSPLEKSINDTDVLELKYNQNTFSFESFHYQL